MNEVVGQISGYNTYGQVIATLGALQREAEHPRSEAHAEAVQAQISIFEAEAARMEQIIAANIQKENIERWAELGRRLPDAVSAAGGKPKRRRKAK